MQHINTSAPEAAIPNRRAFLKTLGLAGATSAFAAPAAFADARGQGQRFRLFAEGTVDDFSLVWPVPQLPPPPPGVIIRVRVRYPVYRHDLLEWQSFLATPDATPLPNGLVTLFRMRVDDINLSSKPAPNFGLFGQILDNPVVDNPNHSPFGDLTGGVAMIGGQFDAPGEHTTFTLLGGTVAGNHASALRTASGYLQIRGSWQSF